MLMLELTAQNVRDLGERCHRRPGEVNIDAVDIEIVSGTFPFSKARLEEHRRVIDGLLVQLPRVFRVYGYGYPPGGGGWSFLHARFLEDGRQWGEHAHVDVLLALGLGIGSVSWCFPRKMWPTLPDGLPFFQIMPPKDNKDAIWLDFTEQLGRGLHRKI
jgi:hypothetical protein